MNHTQLTPAPITAVSMNRAQRRRAARRKAKVARIALCAAAALTAGVVFSGYGQPTTPDNEIAFVTNPPPAQIVTLENLYPSYIAPPTTTTPKPAPLLKTVPLDDETQHTIYEMFGEDPALFCTVMAIAKKETRFNPEAVGDAGESIGMMQIHTYWQRDRIERLEITDLTDPKQNAEVAIDFLWWLAYRLAPEHPDSVFGTGAIFMTYNCGLQGAFDLWDEGITETSYSRDCVAYYEAFMAELEVDA